MIKYLLITLVVGLTLGFGIGKYISSGSSQEEITKQKDTSLENSVTIKEEKRPDGTIVKEVTTTNKKETSVKDTNIKIVDAKPDWKTSALVGYNIDQSKMVYGAVVEKRILANIFVGAWGTTDKQAGLTLGMEF